MLDQGVIRGFTEFEDSSRQNYSVEVSFSGAHKKLALIINGLRAEIVVQGYPFNVRAIIAKASDDANPLYPLRHRICDDLERREKSQIYKLVMRILGEGKVSVFQRLTDND